MTSKVIRLRRMVFEAHPVTALEPVPSNPSEMRESKTKFDLRMVRVDDSFSDHPLDYLADYEWERRSVPTRHKRWLNAQFDLIGRINHVRVDDETLDELTQQTAFFL